VFQNDPRFETISSHIDPLSKQEGSQYVEFTIGNPVTGKKNAIKVRIITIPDHDGKMASGIIGFADLAGPLAASRLALNSIVEGVFTVDQNWKLTSFNRAAETITGWTEEEVLGLECKDIFAANICNTNCAISDCIYTKAPVSGRMAYIKNKSGRSIPVKLTAAPLLEGVFLG